MKPCFFDALSAHPSPERSSDTDLHRPPCQSDCSPYQGPCCAVLLGVAAVYFAGALLTGVGAESAECGVLLGEGVCSTDCGGRAETRARAPPACAPPSASLLGWDLCCRRLCHPACLSPMRDDGCRSCRCGLVSLSYVMDPLEPFSLCAGCHASVWCAGRCGLPGLSVSSG